MGRGSPGGVRRTRKDVASRLGREVPPAGAARPPGPAQPPVSPERMPGEEPHLGQGPPGVATLGLTGAEPPPGLSGSFLLGPSSPGTSQPPVSQEVASGARQLWSPRPSDGSSP